MQMKLLQNLFASSMLLLSSTNVMAQGVEPRIHKMCVEAKDYAGCVRAMTTDISKQAISIDQTNRQGLRTEIGNSCPSGMAYAGGGQCRNIICVHGGLFGKNEPQLAGKGHKCPGGIGNYWGYRGSLRWGNSYLAPINNPNCPDKEPKIGEISSCSSTRLNELTGSGKNINPTGFDDDTDIYDPLEDL